MKRIIIFATILLLTACASQAPTPEPGFEVIDYGRDREIQLALNVDWSTYTKVHLETATVEFREGWARSQERYNDVVIRDRDVARIKTHAAELFNKVISRELTKEGGYELASESGAGVMRWTPRIVELDIIAPDRVHDNIVDSLVDSQGSMTIELEIHDSVSGRLLATASQYQSDPYKGYMERTTSATNARAFRLMMQRWAGWLFEQIEKAGGGVPD